MSPATPALTPTQRLPPSSDVITTHDSVDKWLTDEGTPLLEKDNISQLPSSQVLRILLSAVGSIDEARLEHALADETYWIQLRAGLVNQLEVVASASTPFLGIAPAPVFLIQRAISSQLLPVSTVFDLCTPFPYALACLICLAWSFLVSKVWLFVLADFSASSLQEHCRRNV
ncbi:hypothetical protein F4604DRAFT_1744070, partial [Suillus subluteus]